MIVYYFFIRYCRLCIVLCEASLVEVGPAKMPSFLAKNEVEETIDSFKIEELSGVR